MSPELKEQFRQEIIKQLAAIGPVGARAVQLKVGVRSAGFAPSDAEVDAALDYLAGKGFVAVKDQSVSPEVKRWKITAAGTDYAAMEGLA